MSDLRLLSEVNDNAVSSQRIRVSQSGGVNVYAAFTSLGGGTLNIYECPDQTLKPNEPVYSSTTGEPAHLDVAEGSFLLGELTGATNPSEVTLGARTMGEDD